MKVQLNFADDLPEKISCGEQTVDLTAKIPNKYKSNTKRLVSDTRQIHCVSMDTHTYFVLSLDCTKNYLDQGFPQLHAQVRFTIDQLKLKNHYLWIILYSFIYLQCSLMLKKVKIHGVTRLNGKGISLCVQQYEANNI